MSEWTDEEVETANAGLRAAERLDNLEDALGGDVCLGREIHDGTPLGQEVFAAMWREYGIEDGPTIARRPSPDCQHLIDLYGCAGEEALFDLLVKTECERLRREGLMREFEDLLIMDERTPEQAERLRVLDATLVLGGVPWPTDSIALIKAQRFMEQVTATLGKKTRHGEGE